jgi:hypothetical protein
VKLLHSAASIIKSPWQQSFLDLISAAQLDLLIASPFVKVQATDRILSNLRERGVDRGIRVVLLTNLRPESMLNGSTDIEALSALGKSLPGFELVHLPSLHAKVYVADDRLAVVTSANLTQPGMTGNVEYGIALRDELVVRQIRRDLQGYAQLGASVGAAEIEVMLRETAELKQAFLRAERSIRTEARRAFREKLGAAHVRLLRQRAKGKTTQAVLSDTILFLLAQGPLRTTELHPLIQQLHPDICDDSIDRVIDGVHFGKRWKHHVRSAQQALKQTGRIRYSGEKWHLTPQG